MTLVCVGGRGHFQPLSHTCQGFGEVLEQSSWKDIRLWLDRGVFQLLIPDVIAFLVIRSRFLTGVGRLI